MLKGMDPNADPERLVQSGILCSALRNCLIPNLADIQEQNPMESRL